MVKTKVSDVETNKENKSLINPLCVKTFWPVIFLQFFQTLLLIFIIKVTSMLHCPFRVSKHTVETTELGHMYISVLKIM